MVSVVVIVWVMVCCGTMIEVWLRLRSSRQLPTDVAAISSRERRLSRRIPPGILLGIVVLDLGLVYGTIQVQAFVLSPSLTSARPVVPIALMLIGGSLILWSQRI
jgi:hypothetical protein